MLKVRYVLLMQNYARYYIRLRWGLWGCWIKRELWIEIGDYDWGLAFGIGIGIVDWGFRYGIVIWDWILRTFIGDWDLKLRLGNGIGDLIGEWDL